MKGKRHDDETRAAVIAALLAGQGVNETAKRYKISSGLVSTWKKNLSVSELEQVRANSGPQDLSERIAEHLRFSLTASVNICKQTEDKEWLLGQSAAQLALLYGVLCDKAFRILEAIENASNVQD